MSDWRAMTRERFDGLHAPLVDKRMSIDEAVRRFVEPGMTLNPVSLQARPVAALHELIRQFHGRKPGFTFVSSSLSGNYLQLVGAGILDKVITSFAGEGYPTPGPEPRRRARPRRGRLRLRTLDHADALAAPAGGRAGRRVRADAFARRQRHGQRAAGDGRLRRARESLRARRAPARRASAATRRGLRPLLGRRPRRQRDLLPASPGERLRRDRGEARRHPHGASRRRRRLRATPQPHGANPGGPRARRVPRALRLAPLRKLRRRRARVHALRERLRLHARASPRPGDGGELRRVAAHLDPRRPRPSGLPRHPRRASPPRARTRSPVPSPGARSSTDTRRRSTASARRAPPRR